MMWNRSRSRWNARVSACAMVAGLALAASACTPIASYDEHAYQQTTSLKVQALELMGKATEPYARHRNEIQNLELQVREAYEYAKHLPHNEITARQWEILMNPEGHSLFGFFSLWKDKGTLDATFVQEAQGVVSDGFDQIIGLEIGKPK